MKRLKSASCETSNKISMGSFYPAAKAPYKESFCTTSDFFAEKLSNDGHTYFATTPVTVERNAYGRQLGSFYTEENFEGIGKIPMTFIRAPLIQRASQDVQILATVQNQIVAVRYKNQLAISFHPELNSDLRVHQYFVEEIVKTNQIQAKKAA